MVNTPAAPHLVRLYGGRAQIQCMSEHVQKFQLAKDYDDDERDAPTEMHSEPLKRICLFRAIKCLCNKPKCTSPYDHL